MPDATWSPDAIAEWWSGLTAFEVFGGVVVLAIVAAVCWTVVECRKPRD